MFDKSIIIGKFKLSNKVTFFISLVFLVLAIYYLNIEIESSIIDFQQQLNLVSIPLLLISLIVVFLLQFLNWFMEALKFKILLINTSSFPLLVLLKSVYIGNFTAFFTPERIGNFIGRALVFKEKKEEVVVATLIGNLAQLITTVFIGLFSMILLKLCFFKQILLLDYLHFIPLFIYSILLLFLLFVFFNHKIIHYFFKIKFMHKWILKWKDLNYITLSQRCSVLGFSLIRYLVFYFQYLILSNALDLQIDAISLFLFVGILFGLVTFIPSPLPGNLGTREGVAVFLLGGGLLGVQFSFISFLVWLINVGFSTIFGGLLYSYSYFKK